MFDEFSIFKNQNLKRYKFYKKNKYIIEEFDKDPNSVIETEDNSHNLDFLE